MDLDPSGRSFVVLSRGLHLLSARKALAVDTIDSYCNNYLAKHRENTVSGLDSIHINLIKKAASLLFAAPS
jgi:hypothetical protein